MFRKYSVIEIFQAKEGGSFTVLSIFVSHRTEKTLPGNHSEFQKNSGGEKILWVQGGSNDFPSKSFCLTVPKRQPL